MYNPEIPKHSLLFLFLVFICFQTTVYGQTERDDRATIVDFKGIQYTSEDSTFYVNFRFRMQSRLKYTSVAGNDLSVDEFEARIRRLRLRMDGYLYDPRLSYSIQLAFARGDLDFDETGIPNIVRDAVVFYNFTDDFYVSFGLNKLPGNRQRVTSSGSQQFAERSVVNANFNIDRDFGIKAYYSKSLGAVPINLAAAVTTGEGRVANVTDDGLAYTGRAEILPLGKFKNGGDYSEGDLEREPSPRLSIGGGYSYNARTTRSRGQTGKYLHSPLTLRTTFFDAVFKYAGWSYQAEYMRLDVDNPVTVQPDAEAIYAFKGQGLNQQLSYLISDEEGYEVAGRHTLIRPHSDIRMYQDPFEIIELGLTKYFRAHRLKLQLNGNYYANKGRFSRSNPGNHWGATFQIELGI